MKTYQKTIALAFSMALLSLGCEESNQVNPTSPDTIDDNLPSIAGYPIVGTNQTLFFNNSSTTSQPAAGEDFYGQNAHYPGNATSYTDNGDGTVTDNVTGLMWQSSLDQNGDGKINIDDELLYSELKSHVSTVATGGHTDWRLPTIKELYSLIIFSGRDISGVQGTSTDGFVPFIDTQYFEFAYGDLDAGERLIDVQCASSTEYVGTAQEMVFGVNFADGRIKGYGTAGMHGDGKSFNFLLVRGRTDYGQNTFADNGDGTITDQATGLMWAQADNGEGLLWKDALAYAEGATLAGHSDWRLPDAKELQSILDYTRSPETHGTAAIDPIFSTTSIIDEKGENDFPYYWSSTTHANQRAGHEGEWAAYLSFGCALGNMTGPFGGSGTNWINIHGAGAQRSDPKAGDPTIYAEGHGPQGDAIRTFNYVRLVRNVN